MFYAWLCAQHERQDRIGDLARRAAVQADFPRTPRLCILLRYLEGAPVERKAMKAAHREWRQMRKAAA